MLARPGAQNGSRCDRRAEISSGIDDNGSPAEAAFDPDPGIGEPVVEIEGAYVGTDLDAGLQWRAAQLANIAQTLVFVYGTCVRSGLGRDRITIPPFQPI